ncbi:hypothetical protein ACFPL7_04085 [Dongia soli]|uniref:Uncharacterized protein n=1 Tax=Dongia soli TaxID=600628 RepID=A0ABU5EF99_9PROT|nr:hypothetical protein [Dongia soli]MDY0884529.1 hypothetical protein [Dongia soli]
MQVANSFSASMASKLLIQKVSDTTTPKDDDKKTTGLGDQSGLSQPAQDFLDYMKKTPAQRMVDAWLKQHNLTQEELNAMPADQREAITKQMAADLKAQMQKDQMQKQEQAKVGKPSAAGGIATLIANAM